jgi:pyrroline-5-carboxylate reductase
VSSTLKNITGTIVLAGAGKMGGAMLTGWLAGGLDARRVVVVEPYPSDEIKALVAKGRQPQSEGCGRSRNAGRRGEAADIPRSGTHAEAVRRRLHAGGLDHGGHQISALEEVCGGMVVRAMPNTPAAIGRGITVAVPAKTVSAAQTRHRGRAAARHRLGGMGRGRKLMDAVTAVSGSGPGLCLPARGRLARAGVEAGLPLELATKLARETVAGSGELLHRSDLSAATLRQNVTSPGGTTAAALEVLMAKDGLQPLMIRAIAAATKRSIELAK